MIPDELLPLRDVLRTRLALFERCVDALNSVARLLEKMNVRDVADLPELMQCKPGATSMRSNSWSDRSSNSKRRSIRNSSPTLTCSGCSGSLALESSAHSR